MSGFSRRYADALAVSAAIAASQAVQDARLSADTGADTGYKRTRNYVAQTIGFKLLESISVKDFPWLAKVDGETDDTAAVNAAIAHGIANGLRVTVPHGICIVDALAVTDAVYNFELHFENTFLQGSAAEPREAVIAFVNCVDHSITGNCHVNAADNDNYAAGVAIRAQTGTAQAVTRLNLHNVTVRNAKVGVSVGVYDVDYQCSEINLFGFNTFACPIGAYVAGSQTGVSFNGCNIISEPNAAYPGIPERALWTEGGFVTVNGGSLVLANTTGQIAILHNPASSATYGNPYGIIRLNGCHVETASQLLVVSNPRALAAPTSSASYFSSVNSGGFVSGAVSASDFVLVSDATYAGLLDFPSGNYYSGAARTGYNISSASSAARIKVGRGVFGTNFADWLGGVSGGIVLHGFEPMLSATAISATQGTGEHIVKFTTKLATGPFKRYQAAYDTATGLFTVPAGGLISLRITAFMLGGTASAGDIYVKVNGAIKRFGTYTGVFGQMYCELRNLAAGDTVGLYTNAAVASAFDGGAYQSFELDGATL